MAKISELPAATVVTGTEVVPLVQSSTTKQSTLNIIKTWLATIFAPQGLITASGLTQNTNRLLGRTTAAAGAIEEVTVGTGLTLSGDNLSANIIPQIQSISASVATNVLTISASALSLDFRSTTLGSGTITTISGTPSNLVIPTNATLGTINTIAARLVVYALNNSGTIELAIGNYIGSPTLDENSLLTTTTISAAATSASVVYSTTGRTSVAFRVLGYLDITETTAGTWATAPSAIQGLGGLSSRAIPINSMVRLHTANGYGSTNTKIHRFATTVTSQGSDITYTDSAASGGSFTINTNGVYSISSSWSASSDSNHGLSLNSSQLTTDISAITATDRLISARIGASAIGANTLPACWTGYLAAGSVIRSHGDGTADGTVVITNFTIVRTA